MMKRNAKTCGDIGQTSDSQSSTLLRTTSLCKTTRGDESDRPSCRWNRHFEGFHYGRRDYVTNVGDHSRRLRPDDSNNPKQLPLLVSVQRTFIILDVDQTDMTLDLMRASRNESSTQQPRSRDRTAPLPTNPTSNAAPTPGLRTSIDIARDTIRESTAARRQREEAQRLADMQRTYNRKDLEGQVTRRWKLGDVYAPHDLSGAEMAKWKKVRRRGKQKVDVVDQLGINPIDHYKVCMALLTQVGVKQDS